MRIKKEEFVKALIILALFTGMGEPLLCRADTVEEHAESVRQGIALRDDAPLYAGPVQDGDLEKLTLEDFETFGAGPGTPEEQYGHYRKTLEVPAPGILVPYRMKIVDRDLAQDDFSGFNVTEELAEARYEGYLDMNPVTVDGRTIHYVFVYHKPFAPEEAEFAASNV